MGLPAASPLHLATALTCSASASRSLRTAVVQVRRAGTTSLKPTQAKQAGRRFETINGDAFSTEIKQQVVSALRERFSKVDMIVYSLASPKRTTPDGVTHSSVLKPIGRSYSGKTIDLRDETIDVATIDPASDEEIAATTTVMGGEDWADWVNLLKDEGLLADGCRSVAYSYIGPDVTHAIYRAGTIGKAKEHLEQTARDLNAALQESCGGNAWVSVNKALVTQASAAIPVVPLYISLLYKVMKNQGTHEGCIEQIVRLFKDHIGPGKEPTLDPEGRIRIDDWEMDIATQSMVEAEWGHVTTENLHEQSDYPGFKREFRQLFGFEVDGIDYEAPTEIVRDLV